jgi:methionyl-tRNA formyltransferase
MKIGIITTGSPRAAVMAGPLIARHRELIAGIFIERRYVRGCQTPGQLFRAFVRCAGLRAALVYASEFATCAAALHAKPGRSHHALSTVARKLGIPVESIAHANHADFIREYGALSPDLTILLDAGSILNKRILAVPRMGTINLHTGLLPRYKGMNTAFHSLLEGAVDIGCTVHEVIPEIDAGRILGQCKFAVDPDESLVWHRMRSSLEGAALLAQVVERISEEGWPDFAPMPEATCDAAPYSWPKKGEVERFRQSGRHLVRLRDLVQIWRQL